MTAGRPRGFDAEKALQEAMNVFLAKGYEGASMCDLTKAMGINPPSLYAAFGNKQSLFLKAVDLYADAGAAERDAALEAPTAREAVERLLRWAADHQTKSRDMRGCLLVQGALACGEEAVPVRRELAARRAAGEKAIRQRLERAQAEGELGPEDCPAALARFVTTLIQGMAVHAQGGASRKDLHQVVDVAMRGWPAPE